MFHLTINGTPLCRHTDCVAGMDDRRSVRGQPTCSQGDVRGAGLGAQAWKAAHPHHTVAIVVGPCPLAGEEVAPWNA